MPNGDYAPYEAPQQELPSEWGITREEYLSMLRHILTYATAYGWDETAEGEYQRAVNMLNQGYFGPGLPRFAEVLGQYQEITTPEPKISLKEEQIGGFLYLVPRDEQGNIIANSPYFKSLGAVEVGGLSAWQQQQSGQWQQEFQLQQQQLQMQQEQARMQQQQAMMPYERMTAAQRAQYGLQQQAYRAETMAMPPSGWIEQWYRMQGGQVGYKPEKKSKRLTEEQYATRFRQTIPKARQAIEGWERGQSLPSDMPLPGNWIYIDETTPTRGVIRHTIEEPGIVPVTRTAAPVPGAAAYKGLYAKPGLDIYAPLEEWQRESEVGYQMVAPPPKPPTAKREKAAVKRPTTPPAPPGLSGFVPSQVTGQPITRAPTTTPSGQQWGATPWSTQEMLRGYTGWAGYRPYEDIMQHMYAMQPRTPAGAGYKRWTPARQYA